MGSDLLKMVIFHKKNMRTFAVLLGFSTVLLACQNQSNSVLSKNEMAEIIADFAIYNQAYDVNPKANVDSAGIFVLKKHHINTKVFQQSMEYYVKKPKILEEIYNEGQKILIKKNPKLKSLIPNNK